MSFFRPHSFNRLTRTILKTTDQDARLSPRSFFPLNVQPSLSAVMDDIIDTHMRRFPFHITPYRAKHSSDTSRVLAKSFGESKPLKEALDRRRSLNTMLDRLFADTFMKGPDFLSDRSQAPSISVNVYQSPNAYTVSAEVPGVKKEDISVSIEEGQLVIEAERKHEIRRPSGKEGAQIPISSSESGEAEASQKTEASGEGDWQEIYIESGYGRAERRVSLPEDADFEGEWKASYDNGVIEIEVPRVVREQSKRKVLELK